MTEKDAKKIGSKEAIKCTLIGFLIAQFIMTLFVIGDGIFKAFFWFVDFGYNLNILIAMIIMLVCAYYFGQKAGIQILIEKKESSWIGFKFGFYTLFVTAFFSSLTSFITEGLENIGTDDNPFEDYIFKPMFWVLFFGILPVLFVGFWFGNRIKKHNRN